MPWGHINVPVEFSHLEVLLPTRNPTLGIYNTYSMPVTCRTAYIAFTLGDAPLRFSTALTAML